LLACGTHELRINAVSHDTTTFTPAPEPMKGEPVIRGNTKPAERIRYAFAVCLALVATSGFVWAQQNDPGGQQFFGLLSAGKYAEAETLASAKVDEVSARAETAQLAIWLNYLGIALREGGHADRAVPLHEKALAIFERINGPRHFTVAYTRNRLGEALRRQGQYARAEPHFKEALAINETAFGRDDQKVAFSLNCLANLYFDQGGYAEAEPLFKRALRIYEKALGPEDPDVAVSLNNLANVYKQQSRYAEAEPLYKRALAIREKALGHGHRDVAGNLGNLANLYEDQGRYAEAERLYRRALLIQEKALGPFHPDVTISLSNLAGLHINQGRSAEAEPLLKRALAIGEKALGPEHPNVAAIVNNLAAGYESQGRYAEAEALLKRALAIKEKTLGAQHPDVAPSLICLANVYMDQGRYHEAEPLYKRALAIKEMIDEHAGVANMLIGLANVHLRQARYAEAEPLYRRAIAIHEKASGAEQTAVAISLFNLAGVYCHQRRYAEAEPLYRRAMATREKALGADHPDVAQSLAALATVYCAQGQYAAAGPLLDRSIAIEDRAGVAAGYRFNSYDLRAWLSWKAGHRAAAIADLNKALDLAEEQRGHASGAARERAGVFTTFAGAFERMVAWQTELGDPGEAFRAIERSHARSLLDELRTAGADLDAGRSAADREQLRAEESDLKGRAARLERQLSLLESKTTPDEFKRLEAEVAKARYALYDFERDARNGSPIYRDLITRQAEPPKLEMVRDRVLKPGDLLLVYLLGEEAGYVAAVTRESARMVRLELGAGEASALDVKPGPLTAQRLFDTLIKEKEAGMMGQLSDPMAEVPTARLAALWRALVPEPERQALVTRKVKRLIVVPDGPLALLPFESLVVEQGRDPEYLLDAGPPIAYAPSAAVLMNLLDRPVVATPTNREPVLALGDPAYPQAEEARPDADASGFLTSRSRYAIAGGKLPRLPHSRTEADWVAKSFTDSGIKAGVLSDVYATERAVRYWAPGRKVLHMACHGLADASYGNYFGSLALTPGPQIRADNDGFLTLAEICELKLKGCELAILSACQTNYGPQQKGEGTWALSRGFLVAGARRVVASNWLVDDEAAASLVSRFCGGLAQAEKAGKTVDYAASLQEAKRWVRKQEKWRSPYYWASLVLVGPP
jgi:tetratricopeptide (TPR) repeat protein/CHAT domain-containing protein